MRLTATALSLFLLTGCTAINAATAPIASAAPAEFNQAKKALTAAHELHRATADFLVIAANSNLCHAACASTAKTYLDQSEAALVAADQAVKLGDAAGIEAKIAAATTLIGQVQALVGKH